MYDIKLPSGTDYGRVLMYGYVDGKDFTLACCTKDDIDYQWVVEHKDGAVVLIDTHKPFHAPIFGLDQGDWMDWVNKTYDRIDVFIAGLNPTEGSVG